jgi:hypothetical protein
MQHNEIRSISDLIKFFGGGINQQINSTLEETLNTTTMSQDSNSNTDNNNNLSNIIVEKPQDCWERTYASRFNIQSDVRMFKSEDECVEKTTTFVDMELKNQVCSNSETINSETDKECSKEISLLCEDYFEIESFEESITKVADNDNSKDYFINNYESKKTECNLIDGELELIRLETELASLASKNLAKERKKLFEDIAEINKNNINIPNKTKKIVFNVAKYDCFYTGTSREGISDKYYEARIKAIY